MNKALPLAQLKSMSTERRRQALGGLIAAARGPANGEVRLVEDKVRAYEARFDCSSETMRERVARGDLKETADVCDWLMLLDLQARLASAAR